MRSVLLGWYDAVARELPWRRTRDPYAIWVSEVMLQQTRVETVVRYYDRFLTRFPTPYALADAAEDAVMASWSGLGYYRRARLLHQGVREVVARYAGALPEDPDARRALPGIGRYTAGAIGSIAFERPEPIVDGNVARVLCRVLGIETAIDDKRTQARLWLEAERLVQGPRPGALNQALMELGATLCSRRNPRCEACPLRASCDAHATGRTDELPRPRARRPPRPQPLVLVLATTGRGKALELVLVRATGKLFSGLWNLPMREGRGARTARALLAELGLTAKLDPKPLGELEHVLSHLRLQAQLWRAHTSSRQVARVHALRAVAPRELATLGVSALTRKALAHAGLDPECAKDPRSPRA